MPAAINFGPPRVMTIIFLGICFEVAPQRERTLISCDNSGLDFL